MTDYGLVRTAPPAAELCTPADVRAWGRLTGNTGEYADDVLIRCIKAARELIETQCDVVLINQTFAMTFDAFPGWEIQIPHWPYGTISSVVYLDSDGASQTLAASAYRFEAVRGRLTPAYGETWPSTRGVTNAVTITFVSGYGSAATSCPYQAIEACLEIVEDRLKNRGGMFAIPAGTREKLTALWSGRI